jgi:hypothetical protein
MGIRAGSPTKLCFKIQHLIASAHLSPRAAAPPVSEKKFKVEACCLMAVRRAILILLSDQE